MDREKVITQIEKCIHGTSCIGCPYEKSLACRHYMLADALALLKEQETVGHALGVLHSNGWVQHKGEYPKNKYAPVVRCKDCVKHGSVSCPMCKKYVFTTADNWFCADGERKEGQ